jgi:hypothetical protein
VSSRGGGAVGNRIAALAVAMLGMLWWLGFDKYARPLLLAFEAAVQKRPESLWSLRSAVPPDACTIGSSPAARRPLRADPTALGRNGAKASVGGLKRASPA